MRTLSGSGFSVKYVDESSFYETKSILLVWWCSK